jgi:hypothetical protein
MQTTDQAVSRRKFAREVENLRAIEPTLVSRGWWIMGAEFPYVKVALATVNMRPRFIPFAVRVDFTDYDARPLVIKFVDPFDDHELSAAEMMTKFPRRAPGAQPIELAPGQIQIPTVDLYQHYPHQAMSPGFLCLPGVRDYHDHPAHSGDPWELHRSGGEGRLFNLLEIIWRYGTDVLTQLAVSITPQQTEVPE